MKSIVVYYSYSGITERLAEDIALIMDGDVREIIPKKPYSFSYNTAIKEVRSEIEKGYCPQLSQGDESVDDYDLIFIGSPNWLKTFAPPVRTFLRKVNLKGKTIIPFCTHGGGEFGNMIEDYKKECENCNIKMGVSLKADYSFDELQNWLEINI